MFDSHSPYSRPDVDEENSYENHEGGAEGIPFYDPIGNQLSGGDHAPVAYRISTLPSYVILIGPPSSVHIDDTQPAHLDFNLYNSSIGPFWESMYTHLLFLHGVRLVAVAFQDNNEAKQIDGSGTPVRQVTYITPKDAEDDVYSELSTKPKDFSSVYSAYPVQ